MTNAERIYELEANFAKLQARLAQYGEWTPQLVQKLLADLEYYKGLAHAGETRT